MRIELKPVNVELQNSEKEYAEKKVKKLGKFWSKITDAIVYFKNGNKGKKEIELKVLVPGDTLMITEEGESFPEIVDLGVERMIRQIKRYKQKHAPH